MSDFAANLPLATPETQGAGQAHAGSTNAQNDFSVSAKRSLARETQHRDSLPFDDPSAEADAPELGLQSEISATHGSPKTPDR